MLLVLYILSFVSIVTEGLLSRRRLHRCIGTVKSGTSKRATITVQRSDEQEESRARPPFEQEEEEIIY